MAKQGLFVGLITLDFLYLTTSLPQPNQKIVALDYTLASGGPATNAAITFSHLGNRATLMGVVGSHPIGQLIRADLQQWHVSVTDLNPTYADALPTSSIIVTQSTGERAVVSLNAAHSQVAADCLPDQALAGVEIVLIDGHQMAAGQEVARQAKAQQIPVVIDAGSWKPGFEQVLAYADYAICSANFCPPGCQTIAEVFAYLDALHIPHVAITQGEQPIQFRSQEQSGEIPVPRIRPVDTLGAGDVFHGAFCHYSLQSTFTRALAEAASLAAYSCQFFGTRRWMEARMREK